MALSVNSAVLPQPQPQPQPLRARPQYWTRNPWDNKLWDKYYSILVLPALATPLPLPLYPRSASSSFTSDDTTTTTTEFTSEFTPTTTVSSTTVITTQPQPPLQTMQTQQRIARPHRAQPLPILHHNANHFPTGILEPHVPQLPLVRPVLTVGRRSERTPNCFYGWLR
eukprot:10884599-Karenia_brevis.AAC.1